jgi:hypothetical protein
MPKDGLVRLPDHITASLMRALMHVRHTPAARLLLKPPEHTRAPVWSTPKADYDVLHRGEKVGRIWRFTYTREPHQDFPWHWTLVSESRKQDSGHSLTLHEAMEHFRHAWDTSTPDQAAG